MAIFLGPGGRRSGEESTRVYRVPQFSTLLGLRRLSGSLPGPPGDAGGCRSRTGAKRPARGGNPPSSARTARGRASDQRWVGFGGLIFLRMVPIFAGRHIPRRQSHDSRMMTRLR